MYSTRPFEAPPVLASDPNMRTQAVDEHDDDDQDTEHRDEGRPGRDENAAGFVKPAGRN